MANKYCNLYGQNRIKDDYGKINTGFESVEVDINTSRNTEADLQIQITNNEVDIESKYNNHKNDISDKHKLSGIQNDSSQVGANAAEAVNSVAAIAQQINTSSSNANIGVYSINALGTNTYTATYAGLTLYAGLKLNATIQNGNTAAATLNLNNLGAKNIKIIDAFGNKISLSGGELAKGNIIQLEYDGTDLILLNAQAPSYSNITITGGIGLIPSTGVPNSPVSITVKGKTVNNPATFAGCEDTTGWSVMQSSVSVDSANKYEGINCIKITIASGQTAGYVYRDILGLLDKSKYYLVTAHIKNGNLSGSGVKLRVNCIGDAGEINSGYTMTTSYARLGVVIKPADFDTATNVYLFLDAYGAADQYAYIDAIMINEITSAEYALGAVAIMPRYNYIPYGTKSTVGGCIRRVGKNLFDKNSVTKGYYVSLVNGTLVGDATKAVSDYIKIFPSTAYTISGTNNPLDTPIAWYDENKNFIGGVANVTTYIISPYNARYMRCTALISALDTQQIEIDIVATEYEAYDAIDAYYTGELRSLPNGTNDEVNITSGETQRVSEEITLNGSLNWIFDSSGTGYKVVRILQTAFPNSISVIGSAVIGRTRVIKDTGLALQEEGTTSDVFSWSNSNLYITISDTDWGGRSENTSGVKDYFTAHPYKLTYQCTQELITKIPPQIITAGANDTIMWLPQIKESGTYSTGLTITNSAIPIKSLVKVTKIVDNVRTDIATSTCTVASGGLSFTSTALVDTDVVEYVYEYDTSLTTIPKIDVTYANNFKAQTEMNTEAIQLNSKAIIDLNNFTVAMLLNHEARLTLLESI